MQNILIANQGEHLANLVTVEYNVQSVQGVGNLLCRFERPHLRGLSSSPETFLGSVDALEGQGAQSVLGFHISLLPSQVIALQTNGEMLVFSLLCPTGQLMYKSEPYTVVMYKVGS